MEIIQGEKVISNTGEVTEGQPTERMYSMESDRNTPYIKNAQIYSKIREHSNIVGCEEQTERTRLDNIQTNEPRHLVSEKISVQITTNFPFHSPEETLQSIKENILKLFYILRDKDEGCLHALIKQIIGDSRAIQETQLTEETTFIFLGLAVLFDSQQLYIYIQEYISKLELEESDYMLREIAANKEIDDLKEEGRSKLWGFLLYYSIQLQLPEIVSYLVTNNTAVRISFDNILGIMKRGELDICQELAIRGLVTVEKGNLWAKFNKECTKKYTLHILDQNMILELMMQADSGIEDQVIKEYIQEHKIKVDEDIVCELLKGKRLELIEILEEEKKLSRYYYKERSLGIAIEQEQWKFVLRNIHILEDIHLDQPTKNHNLSFDLITALEHNFRDIETKLYICKACLPYFSYMQAKRLIEIFLQSIEKMKDCDQNITEAIKTTFFLNSYNPMKICILAIELIRQISKKYSNISHISKVLEGKLVDICRKIQEDLITEDEEYREIILDKDLDGKEVIKIMEELLLYDLLLNDRTEKVVNSFWESEFNISESLLDSSTSYQLLFNYPMHSAIDYESKLRCNLNISSLLPHFGLFQVWKRSMKARYLLSSIFLLIVCIIFHYLKSDIVNDMLIIFEDGPVSTMHKEAEIQLEEDMEMNKTLKAEFEALNIVHGDPVTGELYFKFLREHYVEFDALATDVLIEFAHLREDITNVVYASSIFFIFSLEILFERFFNYLEHRKNPFLRMETFFGLMVSIMTIVLFVDFYNASTLSKEEYFNIRTLYNEDIAFGEQYYNETDGYLVDHSVLMAILWLKFLFVFKISKMLGHLLKIFANMLQNIVMFLILYIIILTIFSSIGNMLFMKVQDRYNTFANCLQTLYSASLGDFVYDDFNIYKTERKSMGRIYLTLFLGINMIIALNLLIALLSNTYSDLHEKSLAIYYKGIIQERPIYKYSKKYGSLVSSSFPYNIISYLFSPMLLSQKHRHSFNNFILHLLFIPILMIFLMLHLLVCIILLPFAYMKVILHKGYLIKNRIKEKEEERYSTLRGIYYFISYFIFGLPIGVFQIFVDIIKHIKHIYFPLARIPYLYKKMEKVGVITPQIAGIFIDFLSTKKEVEQISNEDLLTDIKQFWNIKSKDLTFIGGLLRDSQESDSDHIVTITAFLQIEEFINANSKDYIVYPQILFTIFTQCINVKKMRKIIRKGEQYRNVRKELKIWEKHEDDDPFVNHRVLALFKYFNINHLMRGIMFPFILGKNEGD